MTRRLREKEVELKFEIHNLLEQKEAKWKQRAKEDWLCNGDRNTRYFHAYATQKKRRSVVEQIQNEVGRVCSSQSEIDEAFVSYYSHLFTSARPKNIEWCTTSISSKVSEEMNN